MFLLIRIIDVKEGHHAKTNQGDNANKFHRKIELDKGRRRDRNGKNDIEDG